jgi:GNAT superfamily N-acetyltransferase
LFVRYADEVPAGHAGTAAIGAVSGAVVGCPVLVDFHLDLLDELVAMWRESFEDGVGISDPHSLPEQRDYFLSEVLPKHTVQVALLVGRVVGFVAASADSVAQLHVRVGHFRQGIGSQLLKWAQAQSGGSLSLYTFARNHRARQFYEHHGFSAVAFGFEPSWKLDDVRYEWQRRSEDSF